MSMNKRLLVVSPEPLLPANHGARVDMWNRYSGLRQNGWELQLVYWGSPEEKYAQQLSSVFSSVISMPIRRDLTSTIKRLFRMFFYPSPVALRATSGTVLSSTVSRVTEFRPSAVVSEFVYSSVLAKQLADHLGIPLLIRSHNIEHKYMKVQQALARSAKQKAQIIAARLHLEQFEKKQLKASSGVLEISEVDARFWQASGVNPVYWVPPVFPELDDPRRHQIAWDRRQFDVGYLGNLWAPNNVSAVKWFLDEILPIVRQQKADVKVMIAGSNPSPDLADRLRTSPNVHYVPNPVDAAATRADARVLINPIRAGSGVNTKSVEMLYSDSPLVVTSFAINGMSEEISQTFDIADDPQIFAEKIVQKLRAPYAVDEHRSRARHLFGHGGAIQLSDLLSDLIEGSHPVG